GMKTKHLAILAVAAIGFGLPVQNATAAFAPAGANKISEQAAAEGTMLNQVRRGGGAVGFRGAGFRRAGFRGGFAGTRAVYSRGRFAGRGFYRAGWGGGWAGRRLGGGGGWGWGGGLGWGGGWGGGWGWPAFGYGLGYGFGGYPGYSSYGYG